MTNVQTNGLADALSTIEADLPPISTLINPRQFVCDGCGYVARRRANWTNAHQSCIDRRTTLWNPEDVDQMNADIVGQVWVGAQYRMGRWWWLTDVPSKVGQIVTYVFLFVFLVETFFLCMQ